MKPERTLPIFKNFVHKRTFFLIIMDVYETAPCKHIGFCAADAIPSLDSNAFCSPAPTRLAGINICFSMQQFLLLPHLLHFINKFLNHLIRTKTDA